MEELTPVNTKEEVEALRLMSLAGEKRKEIGELEVQIAEKKAILSTLVASIKEKEIVIKSNDNEIKLLSTKKINIERQILGISDILVKKENELKALDASINTAKDNHGKLIESLTKEKQSLESSIRALQDAQFSKTKEIETLKDETRYLVDAIKKSKREHLDLLGDVTDTQVTLDLVKMELANKNKAIKDLERREVAVLNRIKKAQEEEKHATVKEIELRKSTIEEQELYLSTLRAEEDSLKLKMLSVKEELAKFEIEKQIALELVKTKQDEIQFIKRSALIEIGRIIEGNKIERLPDSVQEAINSITKA
jgi:chromosome segregation ATPase